MLPRSYAVLQVLGSLSLLFNPTGLVQSVRAGVADLIGLPLAALQNQSLAQASSPPRPALHGRPHTVQYTALYCHHAVTEFHACLMCSAFATWSCP